MLRTRNVVIGTVIVAMVAWLAPAATPADPIRIAYIDPLSGPFAATGENGLNQFRFAADRINASWVRCASCSTMIDHAARKGTCQCGATLPQPMAYW